MAGDPRIKRHIQWAYVRSEEVQLDACDNSTAAYGMRYHVHESLCKIVGHFRQLGQPLVVHTAVARGLSALQAKGIIRKVLAIWQLQMSKPKQPCHR